MQKLIKLLLACLVLLALAGTCLAMESTLGLRLGASYPQVLESPKDKDYNGMIGMSYEVWLKKCLSLGIYPYVTKVSASYATGDYTSNLVGGDLLLKMRPVIKPLVFGRKNLINRIAPYATVGVGVSNFYPGKLPEKSDYTAMTLPSWGLGVSFLTSLPVDFEIGFQKEELASDYLDAIESTDPNDAYWTAFLGVSHTFGKKAKPKYTFLKETPLVLQGITFEFDSDKLTREALPVLNDVLISLLYYPEVEVEIQGHTDSQGEDEYNLDLSRRRAETVKNYLAANGVDETRLTTSGWGETRPIASNDTEEGRAQNRRIEFIKIK